jgi:hypothetical protein
VLSGISTCKTALIFTPIGVGAGKGWDIGGGGTMNTLVEPQYTVFHHGVGTPRGDIFAGMNLQFLFGKSH